MAPAPSPSRPISLQDAILRLQSFWADQGCLIWQPVNSEVGAGTMNPATFLRVLGPEPWSVAYVEPSVRPDDSRYGDNPNRIQTHTQFQVILKPDTGEPQEQYLRSLEALGIDTRANDVRFVEDNWESPALGAWGLGWEVWLNGLEITQFTYFQQAGGLALDPPSVEITYGLERILMALQNVRHFKEIDYGSGYSYGDLLGRSEYEMSVYYLDAADTSRVRSMFELYEQEAGAMLERGLALPAYQYVLKTSHAFNILDARGAVGVTERAELFARMRDMSRACASLWLGDAAEAEAAPAERPAPVEPKTTASPPERATFVLEVGTEELPHTHLRAAVESLRESVPALLAELRLEPESVEVDGTPRRLAVVARGILGRQPDVSRTAKGPRADVAWDASGEPTKAAQGFARKHGIEASELGREDIDGTEFAVAQVHEEGRPAAAVLAAGVRDLLTTIRFPRAMRWNATGVAFSRPVRWLLAMVGDTVLDLELGGVIAGSETRGLRAGAESAPLALASADDYEAAVSGASVTLSTDTRRDRVWEGAAQLAQEAGGAVDASARESLLPEVADLVEDPHCILGSFDQAFLSLPDEVLSTVMIKHQRYLPVYGGGSLLPVFVAVANGERDVNLVRAGNEAVLRARYADARFFYEQDRKRTLRSFRDDLALLVFHESLGSMGDKADRVERLVDWLAQQAGADGEAASTARAAAALAKNDLASSMVVEMTSLAGIMGGYYAAADGESDEVARAIRDHVLPAYGGDRLPESLAGALVGIADRLDTLVGLGGVGVRAKGSRDPYALRRAALGVVQTLVAHDIEVGLDEALQAAAGLQPVPPDEESLATTRDLILRRFEQWQRDLGRRADEVRAVLAGGSDSLSHAHRLIAELAELGTSPELLRVQRAVERAQRISRDADPSVAVDESLFEEDAERDLHAAYEAAAPAARDARSVDQLVAALSDLADPIDRFFDEVLVVAEDPRIAANRLALLRAIAGLPLGLVDLSQLEEAGEEVPAAD